MDEASDFVQLKLFVSAADPNSLRAIATLDALTAALSPRHDRLDVEVIDVLATPHRAAADRITITPTLLSRTPGLVSRLTGELPEPSMLARLLGLAHLLEPI